MARLLIVFGNGPQVGAELMRRWTIVAQRAGRDDAVALPALNAAEARRLAAAGEFPAGSMGPRSTPRSTFSPPGSAC